MATPQNHAGRDVTVAHLMAGIVADVQRLFRQEFALARQELREDAGRFKRFAFHAGTAAILLSFGVGLLLLAGAQGLAHGLGWPAWAGYLAVGGALAMIGGGLLAAARHELDDFDVIPKKTVETLEENVEWLKHRTSSART